MSRPWSPLYVKALKPSVCNWPWSPLYESCAAHHRQHTLRIPTGDIQDPVKRDVEKSLREREQLMPTRLRTPPVAGKQTLSATLWDKLDSTPCGHHMDHEGNYVTKALSPEELLLRRSAVTFDDYNVATGASRDAAGPA